MPRSALIIARASPAPACHDRRKRTGTGDRVELTRRDGSTEYLQLQAEALVTPWLVVLKLQNRRHHRLYLPVLPDMLPREPYRRLRVRLRLEIPRLAGAQP